MSQRIAILIIFFIFYFFQIFKEELFGPVVTAFVYPDADAMKMVDQIGKDTPYALTGALYSEDQ